MNRVIVESPFGSDDDKVLRDNIAYARQCCQDAVKRGEVPFASHLFFPQFLDDKDPAQRQLGIDMGYDFWTKADRVVIYIDRGISPGMSAALSKAFLEGKPFERRSLKNPDSIQPYIPEDATIEQPAGPEPTTKDPEAPFRPFAPKPRSPVDLDKLTSDITRK